MLRKLFGGAVAVTALGALMLGGALSWTNTQEDLDNEASVGELEWQLLYHAEECDDYGYDNRGVASHSGCEEPLLGPDGNTTVVGGGGIINGGDYRLKVQDGVGSLNITSTSDQDVCNRDNFQGSLVQKTGSSTDTVDSDEFGGLFLGEITVVDGASSDCQGTDVSYIVEVTVETVGAGPDNDGGV